MQRCGGRAGTTPAHNEVFHTVSLLLYNGIDYARRSRQTTVCIQCAGLLLDVRGFLPSGCVPSILPVLAMRSFLFMTAHARPRRQGTSCRRGERCKWSSSALFRFPGPGVLLEISWRQYHIRMPCCVEFALSEGRDGKSTVHGRIVCLPLPIPRGRRCTCTSLGLAAGSDIWGFIVIVCFVSAT